VKLILYFSLFICTLVSELAVAQSDYRITQEFKSRHRSFEIAIEYAKTIDELRKIEKEINEFRNEFKGNKELLNRALYPANFESSFSILADKIEYTNKKLSEIQNLETKVTKLESDYLKISEELQKLSSEINSLKNTNSRLMTELRAFRSGYGGSKEAIDSLNNIISELRSGISKRDTLIKEIMDNIFMDAGHSIQSLDDAEKQSIKTNIQGTSLIDNIRNLINDNIEFLDASLFTKDDISQLDGELTDFEQRWNNFGPKLFDIYSTDRQNRDKLEEIDSLIIVWNRSLDISAWKAVNSILMDNNIVVTPFHNDSTFVSSLISYINTEIQNISESSSVKSEQNYIYFAERSWYEKIKPEWVPFLISEDLLSEESVATIELKIEQWKDNLSGTKSYFIYAIIIILAIIIGASLLLIKRKNNRKGPKSLHIDDDETSSSLKLDDDIGTDDKFIDDKK
jgi:predicted  nucleic acid-binding Zn-ribbon protein